MSTKDGKFFTCSLCGQEDIPESGLQLHALRCGLGAAPIVSHDFNLDAIRVDPERGTVTVVEDWRPDDPIVRQAVDEEYVRLKREMDRNVFAPGSVRVTDHRAVEGGACEPSPQLQELKAARSEARKALADWMLEWAFADLYDRQKMDAALDRLDRAIRDWKALKTFPKGAMK